MKTGTCLLLLACCLMALPGHAQKKPSGGKPASAKKKEAGVHYGTASFYANKFNGRKTANGETFSQDKLTAAANIIPLNTWVEVINLRNNKKVVVKVNDRMHKDNKRLIDLSRSAARQLGYTGHGLAKVKVKVLGKKRPPGWVADANPKPKS